MITIKINEEEYTLGEARTLYDELGQLFGNKVVEETLEELEEVQEPLDEVLDSVYGAN